MAIKQNNQKARYWLAITYPENMVEGWADEAGDIIQLPYAYCVHDKCKDSKGEERKAHVHWIVVFPNTTTYNHVLSVFKRLGENAVNKVEAAVSVRHAYDYLIHDTEDAQKKGKYLYPKEERIQGNGFDIGAYEQVSTGDKRELVARMASDILDKKFLNFLDFYAYEMSACENEERQLVIELLQEKSGFFERLTRGNYLKRKVIAREYDRETGEVVEYVAIPRDSDNIHEEQEQGELKGEPPLRKRD